jgi:ankyrin repeat protein
VGVGAAASGDDAAADLEGRRRQSRARRSRLSAARDRRGRPKNLDSGGFTPLLYAARENCIACADVLLKSGADIDLPDPDGVSPLLVAIMNATGTWPSS